MSSRQPLPEDFFFSGGFKRHKAGLANDDSFHSSHLHDLSESPLSGAVPQQPDNDIPPALLKAIGQMHTVGFNGDTITPSIKEMIQRHHVGSVILSVKNMRDVEATRQLIYDLQKLAKDAGHEQPLLIAVDQENGMLNNLHDEKYLSQFPGSMAMVATKSTSLARQVAEATGKELRAVGINWILGPVLDVLTNSTNRLLGVRTMGEDPIEVAEFCDAYIDGFDAARQASCGKHFPGYGNATVDSALGLPIIPDTIEQLEACSLIPYRKLAKKLDCIMIGGAAVPKVSDEMHACLSERIVRNLLREDIGFDGVILSECLEMDLLYDNIGVRQGAINAAVAGCDLIFVCSSFKLQKEAISGIADAYRNSILTERMILTAAERIACVKRKKLDWAEALNPAPLSYILQLKADHASLSATSYEKSVTLVRDHNNYIPLSHTVEVDADILILTPLVKRLISTKADDESLNLLPGETVFRQFGRALAREHQGKILHASYTAHGLTSFHERLIERAKLVIIVTTDATRNMFQISFTKYCSHICSQQRKPLVAVAASSPYDFSLDRLIGTYLCIYEFTDNALEAAAKVLFGNLPAVGVIPGSSRRNMISKPARQVSTRKWLVEKMVAERDLKKLKSLWELCFPDRKSGYTLDAFRALMETSQTHFVVRNSSTNSIFGFCATWVSNKVGSIPMIFVEPSRQRMNVGRNLHDRAMKYLLQERRVDRVQIGSTVPAFLGGIPMNESLEKVTSFFRSAGWNIDLNSIGQHNTGSDSAILIEKSTMLITNLQSWTPSKKLTDELEMIGIKFDICQNESQIFEAKRIISQHYLHMEGLLDLYDDVYVSSGDSKIVVVLDPSKRKVVGSVVLFVRGSSTSIWMPWIYHFQDARIGGICGLVVDPEYQDLTRIFSLGLVACGIRQFKLQGFDRCVIDQVAGRELDVAVVNGFKPWRKHLRVVADAKSMIID